MCAIFNDNVNLFTTPMKLNRVRLVTFMVSENKENKNFVRGFERTEGLVVREAKSAT